MNAGGAAPLAPAGNPLCLSVVSLKSSFTAVTALSQCDIGSDKRIARTAAIAPVPRTGLLTAGLYGQASTISSGSPGPPHPEERRLRRVSKDERYVVASW